MANQKKRRKVFDQYRGLADLLIIQETHSSKEVQDIWENEWGGKIIMNHGLTNARGIAIFIKRGSNISFNNVFMDTDGRVIICDIEENNTTTTCACLYAPNKDDPTFFQNIAQELRKREENKVIIGDFNVAMDVELDRLNTYHNNERARREIDNLIEEFNLKDIWRIRNPKQQNLLMDKIIKEQY